MVMAALLLGCGRTEIAPPGDVAYGGPSQPAPGTMINPPPPPVLPCMASDGPSLPVTTDDALAATLVGDWVLCYGDPVFRNASSVEFTSDRHWYGVQPDGHGGWTRLHGAGVEGPWEPGPTYPGSDGPGIGFQDVGRLPEEWFVYPVFEKTPTRMLDKDRVPPAMLEQVDTL